MDLSRYARDPVAFIDAFITRNEKGQLWSLSSHQRRVIALAFTFDPSGRLALRLLLWGEMKKSGKTFVAACKGLWWSFTRPDTEVIIAANDLEQSASRVFATMVALVKHNAVLQQSVRIKATEMVVSNGTVIKAIASDYRGGAGSRHSLAILDELWGFTSEAAERLFEELTPPPTEPDAWLLVVTLAGFTGESTLLERLYQRGLGGTRLDDELEITRANDLVMFWSHTARQPWQTPAYYEEQRRLLRPSTYLRLHENRWTTGVSVFLTPELWDAGVDRTRTPLVNDRSKPLFIGVDAAQKHDNAAVVGVYWHGDKLVLATHRLWKPSPTDPLDLEATIEAYLRDLHARYDICEIVCDPWQMARSIATLKAAGLPIRELPQTSASTTAFGQNLFDLINGRNLLMYPADDLRQQALNTVAVESTRGWRIAKEKTSKKIDAIVALAMACLAAVEHGKPKHRGIRVRNMFTGEMVRGIDRDGNEWRDGKPWHGVFPPPCDAKGRPLAHPARFIDGKYVGDVAATRGEAE
jgi:hypothetical protein